MFLTIILFLVVLSVLVFVHEAGHFFAAKRMGIDVEEFGFGFPPRLYGIKRGGTLYSLNWIPLGGFVRLKGEDGGSKDKDAFSTKSAPKRLLVLSAGVLMNFVLAALLLSIGFGLGVPQEIDGPLPASARVRDEHLYAVSVAPGTPAQTAGIQAGDEILNLNGSRINNSAAFRQIVESRLGMETTLDIRRGEENKNLTITPEVLSQTQKPGIGIGLLGTGVVSYPWYRAPIVGIQETYRYTTEILRAFGGLLWSLVSTGKPTVDVSGPVGIAVLTGKVARLGFIYLLQFVALLSLNLAIINILPIPALDGGRVLFLLIEKIRGKPVTSAIEGRVHQIGFITLLLLVAVVTFRDILKLFH